MVLVIGGGLAGSLAALALRERGLPVTLLSPEPGPATASRFSYGGVPWWAAPAWDRAPQLWQALEQRHGPMGWQRCQLTLHAGPALPPAEPSFAGPNLQPSLGQDQAMARTASPDPASAPADPGGASKADPQALAAARSGLVALLAAAGLELLESPPGPAGQPPPLVLPYGRVDGCRLAAALPLALDRAGVERRCGQALAVDCQPGGSWRLRLEGGGALEAETVLLAAGAASASLWPPLAMQLATSWAGVLALDGAPGADSALPPGARAGIVMPLLGQRQALEQQSPGLITRRAIVDAGLAPWGSGWLLGQISLVNPRGRFDPEPDPAWMEAHLRAGLARVWPQLACLPASYHQMPVSFSATGTPLVGPVADAPGLWVCAGVSAPFAALPPLVETLADQLAAAAA